MASWFVPLARLRQRRARAADVAAIRVTLRAERRAAASAGERAAAEHLSRTKLALAAASGAVDACAGCARGKPGARGDFAGGDCCSGRTEFVFSEDEIAALAQTGTRARDLVLPRGEQAGCAFRGADGCSLAVAHRPSLCVRYACETLQRELHRRGRLDDVEALARELGAALAEFAAARAARRELAWAEALVRELQP